MEPRSELIAAFEAIDGIDEIFVLRDEDRFQLLDIEIQAEKKAFMGMGKTYNSGIREVLACGLVLLGLTNTGFDWGCQSHMVLKKDDEIVGEEVWEPNQIRELKKRADVWFLHQNFVVYKSKVNFPQDMVQKRCCFELPALILERGRVDLPPGQECVMCHPSPAGDVLLKKAYWGGKDERGQGTVLFGLRD